MDAKQETTKIRYFSHIKYVLAEEAWFKTPFLGYSGKTRFIQLFPDGWVNVKPGWGWDGPSGLTIDTKSSMRGSLVHDIGALCMRQEFIPQELWPLNDGMLKRIVLEDGMWKWRADMWVDALSLVKGSYGRPSNKRVICTAP